MHNIVIGGISSECTSYSTLEQNKTDFKRIKGKKLIDYTDFNFSKYKQLNIHPIFFDYSVPGGPLDYKNMYRFCKRIY
jgi:hypothetical protein